MSTSTFSIAIHGGAGTILKSKMTPEMEKAYTQGLQDALDAGKQVLASGGTALDAVQAAVIILEDNPLFNAGKGAVFNHKGSHDLDASMMCGHTLSAGAVAGVRQVKNPICLARTVLDHSEHILLTGPDVEDLIQQYNIERVDDAYYFDAFRHQQYLDALAHDRVQLDHTAGDGKKMGTVGAVARDIHGHLAAATSTGGLTNKKFGRVGDTPIIGAGTYANDNTCAISCTGVGEKFILESVAFQIHLLMSACGMDLKEACDIVVHKKLVAIEGEGGLIAVDSQGNIYMPFNSEGMYRAQSLNGVDTVSIYK